MNAIAPIGHNGAPDPIDQITAEFSDVLSEAENWLDGTTVQDEAQMNAVDDLRKSARKLRLALEAGQKSASAPLHDAWKMELARWKPTLDDAGRIEKGLVALVDAFKRQLAAAQAEAKRKADAEAWEATRAAREAAAKADAANLEQQRAVAEAERAAEEAQRRANEAAQASVKGMRTFDVTEVLDGTAYARWLWQNDRAPLVAWMEEHARRNKHHVPGVVETRKEKRAV